MLKLFVLTSCILIAESISLQYSEFDLEYISDNPRAFVRYHRDCKAQRRHCYSENNKFKVSQLLTKEEKEGQNSSWAWLLEGGTEPCENMLKTICGNVRTGPCENLDTRINFCRQENHQPDDETKAGLLTADDDDDD